MMEVLMAGNNLTYIALGAVGISMGVSIFLYREMKKMKSDIDNIQKKSISEINDNIESNTETVKNIDQKINQLAQNMQQLHIYMRNSAAANGRQPPPVPKPMPQPPPPQPKLPKPDGVRKVKIVEGGPRDTGDNLEYSDVESHTPKIPPAKIVELPQIEVAEESEESEGDEIVIADETPAAPDGAVCDPDTGICELPKKGPKAKKSKHVKI